MRFWLLALVVASILSRSAFAQEDKKTDDLKPADPDTGESTVEEQTLGLLPNPFEKQGVKFAVTYIGEVLGNPTGGAKQGTAYEDRINFAADVDFEKLIGLKQLTFHANVFQIDGGGLSRGALLNFLVVSGIEALPTTRLYEVWFEQKWGTKLALRAGQLAADTEFMTAKYTDVFTNASLGWPAGFSLDMPSGGPSPPLAAMGTRLRADITDNLTLIGGVFDGDAAGPGPDDPQLRDRYGVNFRVNEGRHRHSVLVAGGGGPQAHRRSFRRDHIRARHHRHGTARHTRAGGIHRVRNRRGTQMAGRPVAQTEVGRSLLFGAGDALCRSRSDTQFHAP
jgi:porin